MPLTDLTHDQLLTYRPEIPEPADLDQFWAQTLTAEAAHPLAAEFQDIDNGLSEIQTFDVTYAGAGGSPVRGWLHLPRHSDGPLPTVVQYIGYSGGRGLPWENNLWASAGYAHLVMDTRGQGWGNTVGATADGVGADSTVPGMMTKGIGSQSDYYYRRVYVDAVRAVAVARAHPRVDPSRVAVTGGSQGGGLTLAVASLVPDVVAAMPDVPFLSHFRRAAEIAAEGPYTEIAKYLQSRRPMVARAFETLSYFDVATLGKRAMAPALFSIALMDAVCPPSTCFAAYHAYAGPKEVRVYEFNDHEGGQAFQLGEQLRWLRERMG